MIPAATTATDASAAHLRQKQDCSDNLRATRPARDPHGRREIPMLNQAGRIGSAGDGPWTARRNRLLAQLKPLCFPRHRSPHHGILTKYRTTQAFLLVCGVAVGGLVSVPCAHAAPAPEVEYLYNVAARRHYNFPANDAVGYGRAICDKVSRSESYAQIMGEVKNDVTPSDEFAASYLVSYAVNLLCPAEIWQLRQSATGYRPPSGATGPDRYY